MDKNLVELAITLSNRRSLTFIDGSPTSRLSRVMIDPLLKRVIRKVENTSGTYEAESLLMMELPESVLTRENINEALDELHRLELSLPEGDDSDVSEQVDVLFPTTKDLRRLMSKGTVLVREELVTKPTLEECKGFTLQLGYDPSDYFLDNPVVVFFRDLPRARDLRNIVIQMLALRRPVILFGTEDLDDESKTILGSINRQGAVMDFIILKNEDDLYDAAHYCGVKVAEVDLNTMNYESFNLYDFYDYRTKITVQKECWSLIFTSQTKDESWIDTLKEYRDKTDSEYQRDQLDIRVKRYSGELNYLIIPKNIAYNLLYDELNKYNVFRTKSMTLIDPRMLRSRLFTLLFSCPGYRVPDLVFAWHFINAMKLSLTHLLLINRSYHLEK